jgi:ectoine hydroxylase-related dioxygenase (phytanoyl-CoA dioxygenase family)
MATALADMGVTVTALDAQVSQRLNQDGYVALPGVLSGGQVDEMRARLAELLAAEGDQAGREAHEHREAGSDRLADLVNKGAVFEPCFTDPRVLACVAHVLGEFRLSSLNSRAALPGQGQQRLHADWDEPVPPGDWQVCNSIWLLDDFTTANGATRVVPGSHRSGTVPRQVMPDPAAAHPGEVLITGQAGTVVVFNAHLWHGGTCNRSGQPRRALHSYFTRRGNRQQVDQGKFLRPQTRARLSAAALFILDV